MAVQENINTHVIHLGGEGMRAHFASANGFPPHMYRVLFRHLSDVLHVDAFLPLPMRADTPPPPSLSWHMMADELAARLQEHGYRRVLGIGHSLGGVLTLLIAAKYSDIFSAMVLMDPVIFPRRVLWPMRLLSLMGLQGRFPLVQKALRRRRVFPSQDALEAHYKGRAFFARWEPDALKAYVQYGTRPRADGRVELAYPPEWEAAIFASVPTDIWRWISRVSMPTLVIYGERSNTFMPPAVHRLQKMWPRARFVPIANAGHMFPVEAPRPTARAIRDFVQALPASIRQEG